MLALGSLAWGLAIESDVVILNGIFSLVSLVGSVLYLVAARLVARPADRRFQYGYAHVEPLVNGVNALLVLVDLRVRVRQWRRGPALPAGTRWMPPAWSGSAP